MTPTPRRGARPRGGRRALGALVAGVVLLAGCLARGPAPAGPGTIMGPSSLTASQIAAYVCHVGRCATWLPEISPQQMAQLYIDEGVAAGVRGDLAFVQAVLETGGFPVPPVGSTTWPGFVLPRDHNYAGIGAFPGSTVYMRMPTPQLGVRAQI